MLPVRIPDARDSGMVSIHEAEEGCLRVQGQPEQQGQTLLPNLEKRNSKTTNNQHTFIHIHSTSIYPTNIHSYTCIQPTYIHTYTFNQDTFIHIHSNNIYSYTYIHTYTFNQDIFTHNQQPTVQSPISSKFEFTQQAHSTVNTAPTLRSLAVPVPSDSSNFRSFCCIHKYGKKQDITSARQGRGMDV